MEQPAVHHHAGVSARGEVAAAERSVDEIQVGLAARLVETERHLEPAKTELCMAGVVRFDEDVLPGVLLRIFAGALGIHELALGQLALDVVLNVPEQLTFYAHSHAMDFMRLELDRVVSRVARVELKLRREVETEVAPRADRRMFAPHESQAAGRPARLSRLLRFTPLLRLIPLWRKNLRRENQCRCRCAGRRRRRRRHRWIGALHHQSKQDGNQHEAPPAAATGAAPVAPAAAPMERNRPSISTTAAGSLTTSATSRRKSRLSAANARLPMTTRSPSSSIIFPCDLRPQRSLSVCTVTFTPCARRALSSAMSPGSETFASITWMLVREPSISPVNWRRARSGPTIRRSGNPSGAGRPSRSAAINSYSPFTTAGSHVSANASQVCPKHFFVKLSDVINAGPSSATRYLA